MARKSKNDKKEDVVLEKKHSVTRFENGKIEVEELPDHDNRYVLVHAVAKRGKNIMESISQSSAHDMTNNKAIITAIQEIIPNEGY